MWQRIALFTGINTLTQILALLAGIISVRAMATFELAYFSIAFGVTAAVSVIAGTGVSSVLMARGGRAIADGRPLSTELVGAYAVRRTLVFWIAPPALVLLAVLLTLAGDDPWDVVAIACGAAVIFAATVAADLSRVTLLLLKDLRTTQGAALASTLFRLGLFWLLAKAHVDGAVLFIAAVAAASVLEAGILWGRTRTRVPDAARAGRTNRHPYWTAVKRSSLFNITQVAGDQVQTITLTLVGNITAIAEISAMSRYRAGYGMAGSIVANIVNPRVAVHAHGRTEVKRAAWLLCGAYGLLVIVTTLLAWVLAPLLLSLLGPEYQDLTLEFVIVAIAFGIGGFSMSALGAINYARGWQRYSWTFTPLLLAWFLIGISVLDLSTTLGASLLLATSTLPVLLAQVIRFVAGFRSLPRADPT